MEPYRMAFRSHRDRVRLVLTAPTGSKLLRATLPPPATFWSGRPAKALLESLAIWLDAPLRVAFTADDPAAGFSLELTDELGIGKRTVFYEVVSGRRGSRRASTPTGGGDLHDGHQLCLIEWLNGGRR